MPFPKAEQQKLKFQIENALQGGRRGKIERKGKRERRRETERDREIESLICQCAGKPLNFTHPCIKHPDLASGPALLASKVLGVCILGHLLDLTILHPLSIWYYNLFYTMSGGHQGSLHISSFASTALCWLSAGLSFSSSAVSVWAAPWLLHDSSAGSPLRPGHSLWGPQEQCLGCWSGCLGSGWEGVGLPSPSWVNCVCSWTHGDWNLTTGRPSQKKQVHKLYIKKDAKLKDFTNLRR